MYDFSLNLDARQEFFEVETSYIKLKCVRYICREKIIGYRDLILVSHGLQPEPLLLDKDFILNDEYNIGYAVKFNEALRRPDVDSKGSKFSNWMVNNLHALRKSYQGRKYAPLQYIGPHIVSELTNSKIPLSLALDYADVIIPYDFELTDLAKNHYDNFLMETYEKEVSHEYKRLIKFSNDPSVTDFNGNDSDIFVKIDNKQVTFYLLVKDMVKSMSFTKDSNAELYREINKQFFNKPVDAKTSNTSVLSAVKKALKMGDAKKTIFYRSLSKDYNKDPFGPDLQLIFRQMRLSFLMQYIQSKKAVMGRYRNVLLLMCRSAAKLYENGAIHKGIETYPYDDGQIFRYNQ